MKNYMLKPSFPAMNVTLLAAAAFAAQTAGAFNLNWNTIDGGGGASSGGIGATGRPRFSVVGTVGQPDAGVCGAGPYTLQSGFLPAAQKVGGPKLNITHSFGAVTVTWPAPTCAGFHLEASARASGGPWVDFGVGTPSGSERFVALAASAPYQFFRLRKACAGGCPQACRE